MTRTDDFDVLARYYDPIMEHVNYERWLTITSALGALLPRPFVHFDAACGTGLLLSKLRGCHWRSIGGDLSRAMLATARKTRGDLPVFSADLRALPLSESVDCITCLFDSLNFLLTEDDVQTALRQFYCALRPDGILYFDVVTERMVTEYFEDQHWEEDNGGFTTRWTSSYDRASRITETRIGINRGKQSILRERIYPLSFVKQALRAAGFLLLDMVDAETWQAPQRRTTRVDFLAIKTLHTRRARARYKICQAALLALLAHGH